MNNLGDDCQQPHLTRQDYERSLNTKYRSNNYDSINITEDSSYQGIVDNIMVELQQKYNLRLGNRNMTTAQLKKIFSRGEVDEVAPKAAGRQTIKTKVTDTQSSKTKTSETPATNTRIEEIPTTKT
jgi:hypothetical protein